MDAEVMIRAHIKEREAWKLYQDAVNSAKAARKSASESWDASRELWVAYEDKYKQFKGLSALASKAEELVSYYRDDWADRLTGLKESTPKG